MPFFRTHTKDKRLQGQVKDLQAEMRLLNKRLVSMQAKVRVRQEEEGERKDVPPKKSAGRKQCDKLHPTDIPHQHDKIMKADTRQKMKLPLSVPPPPPPPLPSKRKKKAARTPKKTKRVVRVVRRVNTSEQPSTSGKVLEQIISKQSLEEQYKRNIDRKQEVKSPPSELQRLPRKIDDTSDEVVRVEHRLNASRQASLGRKVVGLSTPRQSLREAYQENNDTNHGMESLSTVPRTPPPPRERRTSNEKEIKRVVSVELRSNTSRQASEGRNLLEQIQATQRPEELYPKAGRRTDVLSGIRAGVALKPPKAKEDLPQVRNPKSDLLSSIRAGVNLKHVATKHDKGKKEQKPSHTSALLAKLQAKKKQCMQRQQRNNQYSSEADDW